VTEVPEHLLARSATRRAELTGEAGASDAGAAGDDATPAATTEAIDPAASTPAAAAPAAAPAVIEAPPEPPKPGVQAAMDRKKIPYWVMPVLVFFPIWLFLYVGTLEAPTQAAAGALGDGAEIYAAACASCHGGSGGGGVGPALNDGEVINTFARWQDQVDWIVNGSPAAGTPYGDADRAGGQRIAAGGMPAFGESLSSSEVLAVVLYERVQHGGQPEEDLLVVEELAEGPELPANFEMGGGAVLDLLASLGGEAAAG
jgi:mono/diheme cytochrome c family protein